MSAYVYGYLIKHHGKHHPRAPKEIAMYVRRRILRVHQWVELKTSNTYHLLERTLGEGVTVPQIIDLNVLDVVAGFGIDIAIYGIGWFLNSHMDLQDSQKKN